MAIPRDLATYYLERKIETAKQSDGTQIAVFLYASVRARRFLYQGIAGMSATFGLNTQEPATADNPPKPVDIITYKNDKAAARSGWLQQIGFTLITIRTGEETIKQENPQPNPPEILYRSEVSMYYKLGMPVQDIAEKIYATTWQDPQVPAIKYKAETGTVHVLKHRDTTAYI